MRQHHLPVSRTARYWTLGEPAADLAQLWFACHGYGQLAADFLRDFAVLDDGRRLVVAPEGLSRYYTSHADRQVGASWMTREDRDAEIQDYLGYLDTLAGAVARGLDGASPQRWALGFSQGVATVCRWATLGSTSIEHLVLWAGGVPPDLDLDRVAPRLRVLDLVLVYGTRDQYLSQSHVTQELARLDRHDIPHRIVTFEGGHRLDNDTLRALAKGS